MKRKIIVEKCSDCPRSQPWINIQSIPRYGKYYYTCKEALGNLHEYQKLSGNKFPKWCPLEEER